MWSESRGFVRGGAAAAPRKAPISPGFCCVALERPGANLIDDRLLVRDSPVETLGGEHAEFGFGEVEPASVLGRVMPFEPLDEPTRFGGGKSFVERSRATCWTFQTPIVRTTPDGSLEIPTDFAESRQ